MKYDFDNLQSDIIIWQFFGFTLNGPWSSILNTRQNFLWLSQIFFNNITLCIVKESIYSVPTSPWKFLQMYYQCICIMTLESTFVFLLMLCFRTEWFLIFNSLIICAFTYFNRRKFRNYLNLNCTITKYISW